MIGTEDIICIMADLIVHDFSYCGLLLLIGWFLRSRIRLFQDLYIPASVIGGMVGLLLGEQVLGKVLPFSINFSSHMSDLAIPLLALVFCPQLIGVDFEKRLLRSGLIVGMLNSGAMCLQNMTGLIIMFVLISAGLSKAPVGLGHMPFTGFYGGHGIPAIASDIFDKAGYWNGDIANSVGNTFATAGMLFGIIAGIVIINIAARKGQIDKKDGLRDLIEENHSGYVPIERRRNVVHAVTSNDAVNPVAFHMAVILSIVFFAYLIGKLPFFNSFPITINSLMIGIVYALVGRFTCAGNYLDRESLLNISGASLEFLIVSSIAATNLRVFSDYALELLVLSVFTAISTLTYVFFFGKRWHRKHWVENSLGTFGIATGVLATGFLLIRIADPDNRTGAALNLSIAASLTTTTVQMYFMVLYPPLIVKNPGLASGVALVGMIVFTMAGFLLSRSRT